MCVLRMNWSFDSRKSFAPINSRPCFDRFQSNWRCVLTWPDLNSSLARPWTERALREPRGLSSRVQKSESRFSALRATQLRIRVPSHHTHRGDDDGSGGRARWPGSIVRPGNWRLLWRHATSPVPSGMWGRWRRERMPVNSKHRAGV